jgi:type VI secretion system protein ImpC
VQQARTYHTDAANANARLSTQLPYIFAVSRIAHYLKAIMRDKIGSFASRQGVQDYLNTWLAQYVLLDDSASQEAKSKFPLREAHVEVVDVPGKPGVYRAAAFLRPHFQLDELTVSLRLVADLPQSSR